MTEHYGYDALACEYYDSFHKTCRNFDETTVNALADRGIVIPGEGLILDVGCGRGRCIEFLGVDAQRVVQLDSSRNMLKLQDREPCCLRVLADATDVPLLDDQFVAVVGFLIDPFIGLNFFAEAFRLLKRSGVLFASTPTSEWGLPLRNGLEMEASSARFLTKKGDTITVPSTLISTAKLTEMLTYTGFQDIEATSHCLPQTANQISPDIQSVADNQEIGVFELPIIHLVSAQKA